MTGTSWRDHIKVHPAAAMFPMMSDAELVALGEDIKKNGLRQPIVFRIEHRRQEAAVSAEGGQISNQMEVLQQAAEGKLLLLDGRNRLDAMEAVGILDDGRVQKLLRGAKINWADEGSAEEFVISANIHRRHLTHEKKRALIAALLKAKPERSDRETAKIAKVDHKTVAAVRTEVEGRGEIPHVEARTDTKGRQQPSTKQPKASSKEAQIRAMRESLATAPIRPISQSGQAYYGPRDQERDKAADELVQVLSGDPGRIAQIPRAQRVALAKSCLKLLQVSIDDLRPKIGGTASLTNTAKAPGACAVQCDWSAVAQAIEEERSPPGGRDASDAPRDRQHAFGEAEPPLAGPAFPLPLKLPPHCFARSTRSKLR